MTELAKPIDELTAQLILTFYGAQALQEWRADKTLVPITVYQAVKNITADRAQLLDRVEKDIIGGEDPADIKMGDKYYDSGNVIARKKLKREQRLKLGGLRKEYLGDE